MLRAVLLSLPLLLSAAMLRDGESVKPFSVADQFEKEHMLGGERYWVIAWDRETTRRANLYFEKHAEMLEAKRAALIVDVSQTPSGIMALFVLPRMRSYAHPILLSSDEAYNLTLPYEEEKITVLTLEQGRIEAIGFAADEAALEALLK